MKRQILIVGNDQTIYQPIQNRMQGENIEIFYVSSATEALEPILKYEYCLVIMSLRLAEASDMELLRMIRNAQKMPIIALTDHLTTSEKVALFQAGANAFCENPIDFAVCTADFWYRANNRHNVSSNNC